MKTLEKLVKGKKTYIGIIVLALGAFGFGDIISQSDVSLIIDAVLKIAGIIVAVYGRYNAKK
jgi:hypothetical protein